MYKIKEIPLQEFKTFKLPEAVQKEVIEYHGKPLDPMAAYALIKKETKGFTQGNSQAEIADRLLYELLYSSKKPKQKEVPKTKTDTELKKQKLARTASLLKLKLKLKFKLAARKKSA